MPSEPIPAQGREEPKPCPNPWCFSTTRPLPVSTSLNAGTSTYWRVHCACGIQTFRHPSAAEAVADWNTRATPQPIPQEDLREQVAAWGALQRAAEDVIIHYGMGWEMDGPMVDLKQAFDSCPLLLAARKGEEA